MFNPKGLIGEGYDESRDLLNRLKEFQAEDLNEAEMWLDVVTWYDMVDAAAMPAFTKEQAVASMDMVIETANEIEAAMREAAILNFLTGLLFIPAIG